MRGCGLPETLTTPNMTRDDLVKRVLLFGALLGWCAVLLIFRVLRSGSDYYVFLAWNLFLAAVPAVAAMLFVRAAAKGSAAGIQLAWFAVWLVFLPNAPYIVTDFLHLTERPAIPLWYDIALLASCSGTGLLLGYASLADVQGVAARRFSTIAGWTVVVAALFLSGFGIYLGRFLRWNSWDAVTHPLTLAADIAQRFSDPLAHPQAFGVTVIYGGALLLGYVALRVLQSSMVGVGQHDRPLFRSARS